mgnify:CR=1 FL=1
MGMTYLGRNHGSILRINFITIINENPAPISIEKNEYTNREFLSLGLIRNDIHLAKKKALIAT